MRIGKLFRCVCVLLWGAAFFAGCSSSGNGGDNLPVSTGYRTYTIPGSDLVLQIPGTLDVSQGEIEDIHYYADQVGYCYTENRETIDIVLAEACIYYNRFYLYPELFPQNLDNIVTVESYVQYLRTNDPFTFYFSSQDFAEVMSFLSGDSAFIGFRLGCDGQTVTYQTPLTIEEIVPYTRAWIDGFQVGDKIIGLDGISIEGMDLYEVVLLFPMTEGEPVEITVERDGVEITIQTAAEESIGVLLYEDIAYLSVRSFTDTTGEEVRFDYEQLLYEAEEACGRVDKLILDLRGNGGGSIDGMLMLVDYLINLDNGSYPIVSFSGPAFDDTTDYLGTYNEFSIGDFDKTNFVLLIDENSASASEIVAAALKYYGTATLMGETTFGKGIGQNVMELIDGSGVVIPSVYVLPPSGESYHRIGIDPDYIISARPSSFDDDVVLDAAVDYLNTAVAPATVSIQIVQAQSINVPDRAIDPLNRQLIKKDRSGNYF